MDIPAPGGSVGLKTFGVYVAAATAGLALYMNVLSPYVPDDWENARMGPITGQLALAAATAIVVTGVVAAALNRK